MSDSPPDGQPTGGQQPPAAHPGPAASLTSGVLAPLGTMAVLGIVVAVVLAMGPSTTVMVLAGVGGLLIAGLIVAWAISTVRSVEQAHQDEERRLRQSADQAAGAAQSQRHHQGEVDRLRGTLQRLYEVSSQWPAQFAHDVERFAAQVRAGERPAVQEAPGGYDERDAFARLEHEHRAARRAVEIAILRSADTGAGDDPAQRLQVFANLGRRLQSLVNREIQMLDELEKQIEDPEILEGIFAVDHLATRIRRQAENLCVLGGARAPRQWSKPLTMVTTLRSAMQEVEFYKRVKMVLPINGTLRGHNVTEIIHLLAELIENATAFSSPDTTVLLSARTVTAGLAIEVEDRGLGVAADDVERINLLLDGQADAAADAGSLLSDGRQIGLWVVAQLARRNEVRVRLARNIFGGTTAAVVVPHGLLGEETEREPVAVGPAEQGAAPRHSVRSGYSEPVPPPAALSDTQQFSPAIAEPAAGIPVRELNPPSLPALAPLPAMSSLPALEPVTPPAPEPASHEPASASYDAAINGYEPTSNGYEHSANGYEPTSNGYDAAATGYDAAATGYEPTPTSAGAPEAHGWPAEPAAEHEPVPAAAGDTVTDEQRPRLPKRQPGTTHLAPELRTAPAGYDAVPAATAPNGADTPATAKPAEHTPATIAAFRSGIRAGSGTTNDDTPAEPAEPAQRSSFRGETTHHDR